MAAKLGLPALLGPAGPQRDLAMALIISRVVSPGSKLSTLTWWADTTLGADLGVDGASTDDIYAAMDWLGGQQDSIEAQLAARHLAPEVNPSRMALFDLSSSWMEGRRCPLAARGYSRDGKKGKLQIEYGLLTDPAGRPVAVRVFPGNTGDPSAFTAITEVVRDKFRLAKMVMVGDRGMIISARIAALNQTGDGTPRPDPYEWITALRAPAIKKLMAEDGPLQLSLFDEQDLAEITSPDFPGERLIGTYKTGKHFAVTITGTTLDVARKQDQIDAEAALDGFYVLRDFRHLKADDLDLRPVFHYLEGRVRAHVLICMLACYLTWHLRRAWAPLTATDEDPPAPGNPVAPGRPDPADAEVARTPAARPGKTPGQASDRLPN
jgi:hypothetical protein